jgi:hypothetical protein
MDEGAGLNQAPFELRQRRKDMEDEFPGGRRCINRPIAERAKSHLPLE